MIRPCASCGFEFEGNGSFEYCPHCDRDGPPSIDLQAFRSLFGCHGYAPTHHGGPDGPGFALVYYALAHALRSRLNVVIGSGDGQVPAMLRQAQIDSGIPEGRTVLIDRDEEAFPGNGRPYHRNDPDHWFNRWYLDVERIWEDSAEAWRRFEPESIGVLFVDGDHTFNGVLNDFAWWWDRVRRNGVVLMHDTRNALVPDRGVERALARIRSVYDDWDVIDFTDMGTGVAILRRRG